MRSFEGEQSKGIEDCNSDDWSPHIVCCEYLPDGNASLGKYSGTSEASLLIFSKKTKLAAWKIEFVLP